jgi:2-dehydro-3-deoxyphosphogluconate aldolase/(4S)-4-hydroxy-2-oxoglutarate aldolase
MREVGHAREVRLPLPQAIADGGVLGIVRGRHELEAVAKIGATLRGAAYTATEVLAAWRSGATAVKLFPAIPVGPEYVASLRGPYPTIPLIPTGGVNADNAGYFMRAGATAVAAAAWLVPPALEDVARSKLAERAHRLVVAVDAGRRTHA